MLRFILHASLLCFCELAPGGKVRAEIDSVCLKINFKKLSSDKKIQLFNKDGSEVKGRLVTVDFEKSMLAIHELYRSDRGSTSYSFREIEKVRFTKHGRLKPGWMALGGLGGFALGLSTAIDADSNEESIMVAAFSMGLGITGFLLGTIIPVISSTKTIECYSPPDP